MLIDKSNGKVHCFLVSSLETIHQPLAPLTLNPFAAGGWYGQHKMMQKTWKITETLVNGYSYESTQCELSNEYKHDMV